MFISCRYLVELGPRQLGLQVEIANKQNSEQTGGGGAFLSKGSVGIPDMAASRAAFTLVGNDPCEAIH